MDPGRDERSRFLAMSYLTIQVGEEGDVGGEVVAFSVPFCLGVP